MSPVARRALLLHLLLLAALTLSPQDVGATSVYVRTLTAGRATGYLRADRTTVAPRLLTQGLTIGAFDLMGDRSGSLNFHTTLRFHTDIGLREALRDRPAFAGQYNDLRLELMYLRWRPNRWLELQLGRQWARGALGMRDFDGMRLRLGPRTSRDGHAFLELYGGLDTRIDNALWATDNLDVQGIPLHNDAPQRPSDWLFGARTGYVLEPYVFTDLSYQRRTSGAGVGDERVALAISSNPVAPVNVSAHASYHTILGGFERLGVQGAWRTQALLDSTWSAGVERRQPWFDSASIFNLFGANPYDGAWLTWQVPTPGIQSEFEVRSWWRSFHGDDDTLDLGTGEDDANAFGAALAHRTRLRVLDRAVEWDSHLSYQRSPDDYGGTQYLADTRLRVPMRTAEPVFLNARLLGLYADLDDHRRPDQLAVSALGGVDLKILNQGTLSLLVEQQWVTYGLSSTNLYATFSLEFWP